MKHVLYHDRFVVNGVPVGLFLLFFLLLIFFFFIRRYCSCCCCCSHANCGRSSAHKYTNTAHNNVKKNKRMIKKLTSGELKYRKVKIQQNYICTYNIIYYIIWICENEQWFVFFSLAFGFRWMWTKRCFVFDDTAKRRVALLSEIHCYGMFVLFVIISFLLLISNRVHTK